MFGLPQRARLPFLHQKIMFPEDVDVKTVTSCYKSALSEDLWSHLVCPEASKGASHEHSFFVFVHTDLESSLTQSLPNDTQHISQVYSELSKSTCTKMTATQRKCARVLLYSFILFNADARALGDDFLAVVDALRDSLGDYKGKRNGLGHAQRCIMEKAIAKYRSNLRQPRDLTANLANPEEHGMVTQCKSGGDFHGSPDSVLPNNKRQKLVEPTAGGTRDPDCSSSDATVSEQFPGHPQEVMSPISEIEAADILSEIRTKHL
ncbi:hypothetical protein M9434_001456 [Picochlorum sp. BPE23]|nr:hypothetical protein M9434_001456 [Picochlorum sp. BPE23]